MRVEVMEHFGLTTPFAQAGYYETSHHKDLMTNVRNAINEGRLIAVLFYDLSPDKQVQMPKQGERRERQLQELVKKGKRPIALFVDEAHDLNGHTLTGLKRLMALVEDGGGRLSVVFAGHPKRKPAHRPGSPPTRYWLRMPSTPSPPSGWATDRGFHRRS